MNLSRYWASVRAIVDFPIPPLFPAVVIIIDTNPQFGPLTMAGLRAATHGLLPTELEQYGINGTIGMIQAISHEQLRRVKDDTIKIAGVLWGFSV